MPYPPYPPPNYPSIQSQERAQPQPHAGPSSYSYYPPPPPLPPGAVPPGNSSSSSTPTLAPAPTTHSGQAQPDWKGFGRCNAWGIPSNNKNEHLDNGNDPPLQGITSTAATSAPFIPAHTPGVYPHQSEMDRGVERTTTMPPHMADQNGVMGSSSSNGMLSYGLMSGAGGGYGPQSKDIFDTYEAPGINLETGDRFSQLLEAKLNMTLQAKQDIPPPHNHQHQLPPNFTNNSTYNLFPMPAQNQDLPPPLPPSAIPPAGSSGYANAALSLISPEQRNVSIIPGLQPSPYAWENIVTNGQYQQQQLQQQASSAPCQALAEHVRRSPPQPPVGHQQQNSYVDPSTVDALLRDWSQTQIQPDLVAPLPAEVASRPSSGGLSNTNVTTLQGGIYPSDMPFSGTMSYMAQQQHLPVQYQHAATYTPSPAMASAPPPMTHAQSLPYTAPPASSTFPSPQVQSRLPAHPLSDQHYQPLHQLPARYNTYPPPPPMQTQARQAPIASASTPHSAPGSRAHSTEHSPSITVRSHPTYAPQGWPPHPSHNPAAAPFPREPLSAPPGGVVSAPIQQSHSEPLPVKAGAHVHKASTTSASQPLFLQESAAPNTVDARVPSQLPVQNPWQLALSAPCTMRYSGKTQSPQQQNTTPIQASATVPPRPELTKKFSLSTSVKGSTLKSMSKEKRGRKKGSSSSSANVNGHVEKGEEGTGKPDKQKKRKVSVEKQLPDPATALVEVVDSVPSVLAPAPAPVGPFSDAGKDLLEKTSIACNLCRAKKLKCNGARPRCYHCIRRGEECCSYEAVLRRRGPGKQNKKKASHVEDEEEVEVGAKKRQKRSGRGRRGKLQYEQRETRASEEQEQEEEHDADRDASGSSYTSTSDEEDRNVPSNSSRSLTTTEFHRAEDADRTGQMQMREHTRISQEVLKGMSYVLDRSSGGGGAGAGAGGGGIGMGFGWSGSGGASASGSRFELSTARE